MFHLIIAVLFLLVTGVLLPWLAFLSTKQPPIKAEYQTTMFIQSIVTQFILGGIGITTWHANKLTILWLGKLEIADGLIVILTLGVAFLLQWLNFKFLPRSESDALFNTSKFIQKSLKQVVYLSAATSEEIVYRGVMFALLFNYTDSSLVSSVLVASLFALAHLKQGAKGLLFSFLISLLLQICLAQTGILVTVLTHYIINLIPDLLTTQSKRNQ